MSGFFASLVAQAPKVRTAIQLAGFISLLIAGITIYYKPDAGPVVRYLPLGLAIVVLVLGQVFASLKSFPENQRVWLVLGLTLCSIAIFGGFIRAELYLFTQTFERDVDVSLAINNKLLSKPFKLEYVIPRRGSSSVQGNDGRALLRGIPSSSEQLAISAVRCNGYAPKNGPEYDIVDDQITIEMVQTGPATPWSINDFPDPSQHVPANAEVSKPPIVPPSDVLFTFVNRSNDDLNLLLYNCTNHYEESVPPAGRMARWLKRPFPANSAEEIFNRFTRGTGWFVVYVATEDKRSTYLGTFNLFMTDKPQLVVDADGDEEIRYRGSFKP